MSRYHYAIAPPSTSRYLWVGIPISIVVHLTLIFIFQPVAHRSLPEPILVDLVFEPPKLEQPLEETKAEQTQIVSPPDQKNDIAPPEAHLLSDFDNTTKKEQIKRGDTLTPAKKAVQVPTQPKPLSVPTKLKSKESPKNERAPEQQAPKRITSLRLDSDTLLDKFSVMPDSTTETKSGRLGSSSNSAEQPRPFSRPQGSGAAFAGSFGNSDFLPNLPDGDLTLLNTKANLYAVFVRRVATQVFGLLRSEGWESLNAGHIMQASSSTTIFATLSPSGQFISATLEDTSGSSGFDGVVLNSVKRGARDSNPPAAAKASDGNYHFVFKARSWVQGAVNSRTGAPVERRWLMLATGLE